MKRYEYLTCEPDIFHQKPHIFYLMGNIQNTGYVIASYSIKTDKIILKDVSNFIPTTEVLNSFIALAKEKYKEKGEK